MRCILRAQIRKGRGGKARGGKEEGRMKERKGEGRAWCNFGGKVAS